MLHPRCWFYDMLKRRITDDNVTYYATYYHVNDYHVTWELELHLQISTNHRGIWWSKEGEVFRIFPSIVALRWKEMAICHFSWMVKCIKRRLFQRKKSPDGDSMFAQPLGCWLQQDDGAPQLCVSFPWESSSRRLNGADGAALRSGLKRMNASERIGGSGWGNGCCNWLGNPKIWWFMMIHGIWRVWFWNDFPLP